MKLKVFTDGGARGNPGPAAIGVVVKNDNDEVIDKFGKFIGVETNNVAEYTGIINALEWINKWKIEHGKWKIETISFFLDSELIASQLSGIFKVKDARLRELVFKVRELEGEVGGNVSYSAIPREQNKLADSLVNQALDKL